MIKYKVVEVEGMWTVLSVRTGKPMMEMTDDYELAVFTCAVLNNPK